MVTPREKVYNVDLIIEDLKIHPHTYGTILTDEEVFNATMQFLLRKKVNRLCKEGRIFKTTIPGTRYGQVILYIEPREYKILVESSRMGVNVYYFYKFDKPNKMYMRVEKCWILMGTFWKEVNEEKIFFEGHILKLM